MRSLFKSQNITLFYLHLYINTFRINFVISYVRSCPLWEVVKWNVVFHFGVLNTYFSNANCATFIYNISLISMFMYYR